MSTTDQYSLQAIIELLKQLIKTPSFSKEEDTTADILHSFLGQHNILANRSGNNIWARNMDFDPNKPSILLNSHHDTVKPNKGWISDPFTPNISGDKLTGLGSNDAGGPLVSLIATFLHFYSRKDLPYNLIIAATAEEEISGANGIASILPELGHIDLGIVGEPTQMQMAIAEKGLMVLDCTAIGKSGHAARGEGINALYIAMEDIQWIKTYAFDKLSDQLGPVKMTATQIEAGTQHNVVPDRCRFVVDVRTNDCYSNQEVYEIISSHLSSEVTARSFRLNSSGIPKDHPIVVKGTSMGLGHYGSPTLSDQALMPFTTLKIGPGDSARSHTAEEFIMMDEIKAGIALYIQLLEGLVIDTSHAE